MQETNLHIVEAISEEMGVACLSRINDDILMWTHYVEYSTNYPSYREFLARDLGKGRNAVFFTKSSHWAYEEEMRLLADYSGRAMASPGPFFEPIGDALTGVIFGCRASDENITQVRDLLNDSIEYFRAQVSRSEFALNVVPI